MISLRTKNVFCDVSHAMPVTKLKCRRYATNEYVWFLTNICVRVYCMKCVYHHNVYTIIILSIQPPNTRQIDCEPIQSPTMAMYSPILLLYNIRCRPYRKYICYASSVDYIKNERFDVFIRASWYDCFTLCIGTSY